MERPEDRREPDTDERRRGNHNELGFRNVDEETEHDERGSQGEAPSEPPPRE